MIIKVDAWDLHDYMRRMNRDYWSFAGIAALLDYYDSIDPDYEMDCIAICCEFTEYGTDGACFSFDDFIKAYNEYYPENEYRDDNGMDDTDDIDTQEYAAAIAEKLEEYTTIIIADNDNIIVGEF